MVSERKTQTAFRLSKTAIERLAELTNRINQNSGLRISRADVVEVLIRQASANNKFFKKVMALDK